MQELPFFVKLAKPGVSFYDFHSKFGITGEQVKEVKHLSPLTKSWIMNGGLVICDEDGEAHVLTSTAGTKTTPKIKPKRKDNSQDVSGQENGGQESLEDILNRG
jgi:hypothetical protein